MKIKDTIMQCLHKSTSQAPMAYSALEDAVFDVRPQTTTDEFAGALEKLCDAAKVRAIRGQRSGAWQNLYWPLVAAAPIDQSEEKPVMSEPKNSLLNRLILMHGPIAGPALAEKARATGANIPAKNVPGLLETLVRKGEVIVRKHQGASYYMTANQAADWDENFRIGAQMEADSAAHVMSAPPLADALVDAGTKANDADASLLELGNKMLSKKVVDLESDIEKMRRLIASKTETIVAMEDQIKNLQRTQSQEAVTGRLALLLIDSSDLTEVEELDAGCDPRIAQAAAMARIDHGHAARAVVVNIIGEAVRQVAWKAAA